MTLEVLACSIPRIGRVTRTTGSNRPPRRTRRVFALPPASSEFAAASRFPMRSSLFAVFRQSTHSGRDQSSHSCLKANIGSFSRAIGLNEETSL